MPSSKEVSYHEFNIVVIIQYPIEFVQFCHVIKIFIKWFDQNIPDSTGSRIFPVHFNLASTTKFNAGTIKTIHIEIIQQAAENIHLLN